MGRKRSLIKIEEYIGRRFGTRIVIRQGENARGNVTVVLLCDCGSETTVILRELVRGRSQTCCLCQQRNQTGAGHPHWKGGRYISMTLYNNWFICASRRNIEWLIDLDYLENLLDQQNFLCAFTGSNLTLGYGHNNGLIKRGNASLDRIDSNIGYIPGNVQFVLKSVNIAKQSSSDEDFIEMCRKVTEFRGKQKDNKFNEKTND
jgi:hypothetical protein